MGFSPSFGWELPPRDMSQNTELLRKSYTWRTIPAHVPGCKKLCLVKIGWVKRPGRAGWCLKNTCVSGNNLTIFRHPRILFCSGYSRMFYFPYYFTLIQNYPVFSDINCRASINRRNSQRHPRALRQVPNMPTSASTSFTSRACQKIDESTADPNNGSARSSHLIDASANK